MRRKTIPTEEEERKMFENFISKDPSPGKTNRILLTEDENCLLIPGWVIDSPNEMEKILKHGTKKIYRKNNITGQILYDVLVLGLTSIDQRPKCPICGKSVKYRNNLAGKYSGYNETCGNPKCHYQVVKDSLMSDESQKKAKETKKENGGYDHLIGNTYRKDNPVSDETRRKISEANKGKKRTLEQVKKMSEQKSLYYKNNPDKLQKLVDSPHGKSKRGDLTLKKSPSGVYHYLSSWEEKIVLFFDTELDDVLQIITPNAISYTFEGKTHNYFADIDIILSNNKRLLIEIKPKAHLYHKKNKAKFEAGKLFISNNQEYADYLILTEDVIFEHPRKQEEIDKKKLKNLILSYL